MINWGIIGTGNIAHKLASDMRYVLDGNLSAVASRSQHKADSFAKEFGISKAYEGYEKLAADSDIQAVYIATPHSDHYSSALMMLRNGKAVLCEKPLAVNAAQAGEMVRVARENNVLLLDALWSVFLPGMLKVKEWISEGLIGELKYITSEFGFTSELDPAGRLYNPELAGGALLDIGIYSILLPYWIFGRKPESLQASSIMTSTGVDEQTGILMSFPGGMLAQSFSGINVPLRNESTIYGTRGSIHMPEYWKAHKIYLRSDQGEEFFEDDRESWGYDFEVREINRLIGENKTESSVVTYEKSIELMEILDDVREKIGLRYPFE
jgi:dihydrodiol dehydrogenase / D-xylose 1-dehydrogenase (NADP)